MEFEASPIPISLIGADARSYMREIAGPNAKIRRCDAAAVHAAWTIRAGMKAGQEQGAAAGSD